MWVSPAPGFRFHPTDEELIQYYLRRKICGKPIKYNAISAIDIYKAEPWDLPGKSSLQTRDLEWYFFSVLDKKYGNGSRINRATERGYWKITGKDRAVHHGSQVVGMKKTLVYHSSRAPKGQRTNWVMHEYRLIDEEFDKAGIAQDAFVLCRVFQKSGSGPKNGEQYGAPFVEEEWEEVELQIVPKEEAAEEVEVDDDAYLDGIDLEQILATGSPPGSIPVPLDVISEENVACGEVTTDFPLLFYSGGSVEGSKETPASNSDSHTLLVGIGEHQCVPGLSEGQNSYNVPVQCDISENLVMPEYIGESSNTFDVPYMNAWDNFQFHEGASIEANDLTNPIGADTSGFGILEEDPKYFDANDEVLQYIIDPEEMLANNNALVSGQSSILEKEVEEETRPTTLSSEKLLGGGGGDGDIASSLKQGTTKEHGTDLQYPFMKQASHMLGEHSCSSCICFKISFKGCCFSSESHVSFFLYGTCYCWYDSDSDREHWSGWSWGGLVFWKIWEVQYFLSFGLSRGDDNFTTLESVVSIRPGMTVSGMSRGWFYFIFFWVLILSVSFKIGTYICAK